MELISEIQIALTQIAPSLFEDGRKAATQRIHDTFQKLAGQYADDEGLAFGAHDVTHAESKNPDSVKRLIVYGSKQTKSVDRNTQGEYLFDLCWLVFYNSKAPVEFVGCIAGCELVMESEFNFDRDDSGNEYTFLQDFRKLLIANARAKVFVFRSEDMSKQAETFLRGHFGINEERSVAGVGWPEEM